MKSTPSGSNRGIGVAARFAERVAADGTKRVGIDLSDIRNRVSQALIILILHLRLHRRRKERTKLAASANGARTRDSSATNRTKDTAQVAQTRGVEITHGGEKGISKCVAKWVPLTIRCGRSRPSAESAQRRQWLGADAGSLASVTTLESRLTKGTREATATTTKCRNVI